MRALTGMEWNRRQFMSSLTAAGLVGGSIEDATGNEAEPIYEFNQAVERVAAAAEAARSEPAVAASASAAVLA